MSANQNYKQLQNLLNNKLQQFNCADFIPVDPISIPHGFSRLQDKEIMGFWAAMLAWGQRTTILNKCRELIELMDGAPYEFITGHQEQDLRRFLTFKHRTFNPTDTLYFIAFFRHHFQQHNSLEQAFTAHMPPNAPDTYEALAGFHNYFFSLPDAPARTQKHVATPLRKSACKRINMFLRWMVRDDGQGVDFGLWKGIKPSQLICPLDVHVERVARKLGLLERKQSDWLAAVALTEQLRRFDPADPVKYDFALFGMGLEKF